MEISNGLADYVKGREEVRVCVGVSKHTAIFVSMSLCMDVSACQHVSKRHSPPQRDVNSK